MPDNGYTIIFSTSKSGESSDNQVIAKDSPQIKEINNIFRKQFSNSRYDCHLDHLMLFSVTFLNMKTDVYYNGIYVISLSEIKHSLFLTNVALQKVLDSRDPVRVNDIYCAYPSFRFNKFHEGDYFHIGDDNKIIFSNQQQTNSHGLVRSV